MAKQVAAGDEIDRRLGLLGELQTEQQLVLNGWHPLRLDTAQMASNADLIALNRKQRVLIQVKTSPSRTGRHSWLGFGYANKFLKDGVSIFNSKSTPLLADIVVAVSYHASGSRFVVLPVAFAETLCRYHAKYWQNVPTKKGGVRSMSFPIELPFNADRDAHRKHYEKLKKNVLAFENAWHLLKEPIDKLHESKQWPMK